MRTLLELRNRDCRWPVGDGKPQMFCAEPAVDDVRCCYCAAHRAVAYVPTEFDSAATLDRKADFFGGGRYVHRQDRRDSVDMVSLITKTQRTHPYQAAALRDGAVQ